MKTEKCDGCGEEFPLYDLEPMTVGKRTQHWCHRCLGKGRHRVDNRVISRFARERGKTPK